MLEPDHRCAVFASLFVLNQASVYLISFRTLSFYRINTHKGAPLSGKIENLQVSRKSFRFRLPNLAFFTIIYLEILPKGGLLFDMKKIYNVDKPFVEGLNENILLIAKQSFHTMFFMKQLWYETNKKNEIKGFITEGMFPDHELCSIPIKNKKFNMFPWNFNSFDVLVGDYEIDLISECLSKETDIDHFLELQKKESFSKPSFTLKKIQHLTEDFVTNLEQISLKNDIPYSSIAYLTSLITSGSDTKGIQIYEELLEPYFSILIPKALAKKDQINLILKLSNQIYQLLIESFWVILFIDWIEFCKMLNFAKSNTTDELKEYIIERTVDSPLKTIIKDIHPAKIIKYIEHQYQGAIKFYPLLTEFINRHMLQIAERYIWIVDKNILFKSNVRPGGMDGIDPEALQKYTHKDHHKNYLRNVTDGALTKKDEELMGKDKTKNSKYQSGEFQSLAYDFLPGIVNKMNIGLLMTYKLKADPTKLLSYIKSIFYNVAITEINRKTDKMIREKFEISLKTLKQYEKKIKTGEINLWYDLPENFTIFDLTEEEIFKIIKKKEEKQQHKKTGFISQRDLLAIFQNEVFLEGLKTKGHPLKKCGETTLKRALQNLKQDKKIIYTKEKNAGYYRQTDVPGIADELTNYFNTKRKK